MYKVHSNVTYEFHRYKFLTLPTEPEREALLPVLVAG